MKKISVKRIFIATLIGFSLFYALFLQTGLGTTMYSIFQARVPGEAEDARLNPAPPPEPAPAPFYTDKFFETTGNEYSVDWLVGTFLPRAAQWIAGFLGALAVLFLIWAGIQFLTAEGDADKISQATKTAFYVIAGVLLVMFASAMVYLFLTIFAPSSPTPRPATTAPTPAPEPLPDPVPDPAPQLPPGQAFG